MVFERLLRKWNGAINLVAPASLDHFWRRHALDSVQLLDRAPAQARRWVDLGSGGGLPGLVVAIVAASERPDLSVTMIESDGRKAAFLEAVVRECGIASRILAERIEGAPAQGADVVSARALAPLPRLLGLAERHLAPEGTALLAKGAAHQQEIAEALELWRFSIQKWPSLTDPSAVILEIKGLSRV